MSDKTHLTELELTDLEAPSGGGLAPPGTTEGLDALGMAPRIIGVLKQGQSRNRLIESLAKPGGAGSDKAFNEYHKGPAANYLRKKSR